MPWKSFFIFLVQSPGVNFLGYEEVLLLPVSTVNSSAASHMWRKKMLLPERINTKYIQIHMSLFPLAYIPLEKVF